jgi:hypothetical protein
VAEVPCQATSSIGFLTEISRICSPSKLRCRCCRRRPLTLQPLAGHERYVTKCPTLADYRSRESAAAKLCAGNQPDPLLVTYERSTMSCLGARSMGRIWFTYPRISLMNFNFSFTRSLRPHTRRTPEHRARALRLNDAPADVRKIQSYDPASEFLAAADLHALTGYARASQQATWLKEKGVPHRIDKRRVLVSHTHVREWLGGRAFIVSSGINFSGVK